MSAEQSKTLMLARLPVELDNAGAIFSYGSLLEHRTLKKLLTGRGRFQIFETIDVADAQTLVKQNPQDIVILKNVRLENVRVSLVTETILRRWYKNRGGNVRALVRAGITSDEIPKAVFLYARPAEKAEKGRYLNGGLICNFSADELSILDRYEWQPVLQRTLVAHLKIKNRFYAPEKITFYAGTESVGDITSEEKTERALWLNQSRARGSLSPQAKWLRNVRRA